MNKIKYACLIITGLTIFSCQQRINLQSDKDFNEVFTANEVKEIEKMIQYVDDRVIEITGNKDIEDAYHQLIDNINQTMQDSSSFFVPFEEETKYKFLESIDTTVFNEFWYMSKHIRKTVYKDSIYENLDNYKLLELKRNGKYSDYLERIGKNDAYFKSVKETLDMAGGLAPSIVASFLKLHTEFDFNIPKNRLWAAVFILSIEEPHDKKMERYLNRN